MNIKLAAAGVIVALGLSSPALAYGGHGYHGAPGYNSGQVYQAGYGGRGWDFLGSRIVSHQAERDRVPAQGARRYAQVRLCASNRAVRLYDVDVVFRNGGRQDLQVRNVLRPGECTRAIDLRGNTRDIRFVSLAYQTVGRNFGRRAEIAVFAR
jgi:hypothetical protein